MDKTKMIEEIKRLKIEKNAILLCHYYQEGEIQDIADFIGDSLELSRRAAESDAEIIIFAGVHFMAETAKILSPNKKVLMPAPDAGCPMADRAAYDDVLKYKQENPNTKIVCYVNSSAAVKSLSDVCVTSSSATKIMKKFAKPGDKIMYVPDKNLGTYLQIDNKDLDIELWPGFCCIHEAIKDVLVEDVVKNNPNVPVLMHPEVNPSAYKYATYMGSTSQLLDWVIQNKPERAIIATEGGIIHQMKKHHPNCEYILLDDVLRCRQMRKVTIEKIYECIKNESGEINVDPAIIDKARKPIELMLELAK